MLQIHRKSATLLLYVWEFTYVGATLFVLWEVPIRLVTGYQPAGWMGTAVWIASAVLLAGIPVHFLAGKHREGLTGRLKRSITFEIISSLPLDLLLSASAGMPWALLRWIRVLRLADGVKLYRSFDHWQRDRLLHPAAGRLILLLAWILTTAHFIAIGWIPLGGTQGAMPTDLGYSSFFSEPFSRYITSLYWTVTTFATVGYGDISAHNDVQRLYASFVMLTGVGLFGYAIGNIATLIANLDMAKAAHQQRLDEVNAFLHHKRVPVSIVDRVNAYYRYLWENRMGHPQDESLAELPLSLRTEIALVLNRRILEKVPLFHRAGEAFLRDAVLLLQPRVFLPGDYVFHQGDPGDAMYFISRGTLEVISDDSHIEAIQIGEGDCFGEIALTQSGPRTRSVRSLTFSDLYELKKNEFDQLLARYPEFKRHIDQTVRARK